MLQFVFEDVGDNVERLEEVNNVHHFLFVHQATLL